MVIGKLETQFLIEARIVILQIKLINNNDLIIMREREREREREIE